MSPIPIRFHQPLEHSWIWAMWFFAHYDTRIYLDAGHYVDAGAGSLGIAANVRMVASAPEGLVGTIGRWCEAATCEILATGEHANDQLVNVTFNTAPVFASAADAAGLAPRIRHPEPFQIGNAVVISQGATLLPGASIGDGAVIGAGALVNKGVDPFTIVGGVPARALKCRPESKPWWDLEPAFMAANMGRLQELAADLGDAPIRQARPRLVLSVDRGNLKVTGWTDGGAVKCLSQAPPAMRDYVAQADGPGPYHWLADAWG